MSYTSVWRDRSGRHSVRQTHLNSLDTNSPAPTKLRSRNDGDDSLHPPRFLRGFVMRCLRLLTRSVRREGISILRLKRSTQGLQKALEMRLPQFRTLLLQLPPLPLLLPFRMLSSFLRLLQRQRHRGATAQAPKMIEAIVRNQGQHHGCILNFIYPPKKMI